MSIFLDKILKSIQENSDVMKHVGKHGPAAQLTYVASDIGDKEYKKCKSQLGILKRHQDKYEKICRKRMRIANNKAILRLAPKYIQYCKRQSFGSGGANKKMHKHCEENIKQSVKLARNNLKKGK
jgi:hypothetical protein